MARVALRRVLTDPNHGQAFVLLGGRIERHSVVAKFSQPRRFGDCISSTPVSGIPARWGGEADVRAYTYGAALSEVRGSVDEAGRNMTAEERSGHLIVAEHYSVLAEAAERSVKATLEERFHACGRLDSPDDQKSAAPAPWAILTRQSAYATVALGFDREASNMAKVSKSGGRGTTPVDIHVGQKIRTRRNLLGLTQTELADAAGITFQQVQKYEKGSNRVGAGRLQQFSEALGVPPSYFFEGAPAVGKKKPAPQEGELSEETIVSFLGTREGAALVRAFMAIKQKPIRQNAIAFLETLKGK